METIVITAILAFLIGVAVGIAGCFYSTVWSYMKEIEGIFKSMCEKYDRIIDNKNIENKKLNESVVDLQARLVKKGGRE